MRSRIDWKYLLGLALQGPGVAGSVLAEMGSRIVAGGRAERLLDELLRQCKKRHWIKAGSQQRTDSTQVLAASRVLNRLEMVGGILRQALELLSQGIPTWRQAQLSKGWQRRYGRCLEQYRRPGQKAEPSGADGLWLLNRLDQEKMLTSTLSGAARAALAVLRQVWLQQYQVEDDVVRWRPAGQLPPASLLIEFSYDAEARFGQKRELTWMGYRVHLSESCEETEPHLLTQVKTTIAPTADRRMTDEIQAALVAKGFTPASHLLDAGDVDAATWVKSQSEYGIQIVGQVKRDTSPQAQAEFAAADFTPDWNKQQARCPQGHTRRLWRQGPAVGGVETVPGTLTVRFAKTDCDPCPQRTLCTSARQGRSLPIRPKPNRPLVWPKLPQNSKQPTTCAPALKAQSRKPSGALTSALRVIEALPKPIGKTS